MFVQDSLLSTRSRVFKVFCSSVSNRQDGCPCIGWFVGWLVVRMLVCTSLRRGERDARTKHDENDGHKIDVSKDERTEMTTKGCIYLYKRVPKV